MHRTLEPLVRQRTALINSIDDCVDDTTPGAKLIAEATAEESSTSCHCRPHQTRFSSVWQLTLRWYLPTEARLMNARILQSAGNSATNPAVLAVAVAGAVLSTVATIVQMCAVLAATSVSVLRELSVPLFCAGLAAAAYGAFFTIKALGETEQVDSQHGHAFSFSSAIILAAILSGILVVSAALRENFGEIGAIVAAALAGFADTHSAAVSIASLVASGKMSPADAISPILAALSTNTISKIIVAWTSGGRSYALRLIPGLVLVISAAWAGAYALPLLGVLSVKLMF
jgi:uncharacterized membrane protein (DUF4010 family)